MGEPYVVRRRVGALEIAGRLAVLAAVIAVAVLVVHAPAWFIVALIAGTLLGVRPPVILRIDAKGVRMGRPGRRPDAEVPWSSIDAVAASHSEVGVKLRPGSPLPPGVSGIVHGGDDPPPPELTVVVPGLDRLALANAVAAYGGGVPLADLILDPPILAAPRHRGSPPDADRPHS
jgi:hypothetical protein